ncbi:hypothetical protein YC2023_082202 [Brassica napus]
MSALRAFTRSYMMVFLIFHFQAIGIKGRTSPIRLWGLPSESRAVHLQSGCGGNISHQAVGAVGASPQPSESRVVHLQSGCGGNISNQAVGAVGASPPWGQRHRNQGPYISNQAVNPGEYYQPDEDICSLQHVYNSG